jgi:hypothetical protein
MYAKTQRAQSMLDAGAASYLTKSRASVDLLSTIRTCAAVWPDRGDRHFTFSIDFPQAKDS